MKKINRLFLGTLFMVSCIIFGTTSAYADDISAPDTQGVQVTSYKTSLTPPVIDGDLSDVIWQNRPYTALANRFKNNGQSLSTDFKTAWDDKSFYVAANIKEKNLKEAGTIWATDEISIFINANNSKAESYTVPYDVQIGIGYGSTEPIFAFGGGASGRDKNKILRACKKTDTGWSVEVAIPFETLGIDPNIQKKIGFDLSADTNDGTTKFWSNTETTDLWRYTSGFGTLVLSPNTLQDSKVNVTGISLDNTNLNLYKGQSVSITPSLTPSNASDNAVMWTSSDNSIVSVTDGNALDSPINDISNNRAILKAVNSGTATITATSKDGSKTAVCTVKVLEGDGNTNSVNNDMKVNVLNEKNIALGQNASVDISVSNSAYNLKSATLVMILCDSQNKMVDLATACNSIEPQGTSELVTNIQIPSTGKYTLKYFVCDDLDKLTPINSVVIRTIE